MRSVGQGAAAVKVIAVFTHCGMKIAWNNSGKHSDSIAFAFRNYESN